MNMKKLIREIAKEYTFKVIFKTDSGTDTVVSDPKKEDRTKLWRRIKDMYPNDKTLEIINVELIKRKP